MMTSKSVANVASNKYIIFCQGIMQYTTINTIITKLDYKQFQSFGFYARNKIKTMKIYFCIFSEHLECGKIIERR